MFSSTQVVFLFDVNCLNETSLSNDDLNNHITKLKLSCLRLLTEFGAQTENGSDVRWSAKFYDSVLFKPGKANSSFVDFNKSSFDSFDDELSKKIIKAYELSKDNIGDKNATQRNVKRVSSFTNCHSHCYILNKAIQEVLKDYNWDLADVNSPIHTRKTRNQEDKAPCSFNNIIVYNNLPKDRDSVKTFIGNDLSTGSSEEFVAHFLEPATVHEFQKGDYFRLHFVDVVAGRLRPTTSVELVSALDNYLSKFNGSLHCITSIVECSNSLLGLEENDQSYIIGPHLHGIESNWFAKCGRKSKIVRPRQPQAGPELVWEDDNGGTFLLIKLQVLMMQGR